ncbi:MULTISPECIES: cyclase family protein [unclassified Crossiella]|uniref:cyclase family protein n=1 Tax=unclassified Crossiella TaxID=2620835 RepID=UPI001FFF9D70|nr:MULTISPECIES: cyclase family protein [unclassified Crossiella]MCK2244255.1 cyclase family protein [Crossiella sp. S99.2]MCK2258059.1 cyclase family protein [Crossiella sp. S99.1]
MTAATDPELPDNWGRWGPEDELGTLNLITDQVRVRAAAEVRIGRWASLALPITPNPMISSPFAPSTVDASPVQQMMQHTGIGVAADLMLVTNHHANSTHLDALAHWSTDDQVYPGRPRAQTVTPGGVTHASTTAFAAGIVTRGVLLDLAHEGPLASGHAVTGLDFERAEQRQGVEVGSGDALVVRLGWSSTPVPGTPTPGISLDAVCWMHRRGVALFAGDRGDAYPPFDPVSPSPLHGIGLGRMAMPLIDAAALDDLAALCAQLNRHTFLLSIAPPRIHGLTGVPVNPIAVF